MDKTPKANRLHLAIFGRTNVGKSSFLNFISGQDVSITSDIAGTTTDVVEKTMELLPLGPVVFADTAGFGDKSSLGDKRMAKSAKVFERADAVILVTEAGQWGQYEEKVLARCREDDVPVVAVVNKSDVTQPDEDFVALLKDKTGYCIVASSVDSQKREDILSVLKSALAKALEGKLKEPCLISDLIGAGDTVVLVVPIDLEAPKGRLILPQVQTIRDILDSEAVAVVAKERELHSVIDNMKRDPALVVCDSQAVLKTAADTPKHIPLTTFSVLFSRLKGDIIELARGAAHVDFLNKDSRILVAESCTHHPIGDDIGRVKIPRWIRQYLGFEPTIDFFAGCDWPDNFEQYDLVIHCGGCMFNRKQMLTRLKYAKKREIPITNYGICISMLQGVMDRALEPFPAASIAFRKERRRLRAEAKK